MIRRYLTFAACPGKSIHTAHAGPEPNHSLHHEAIHSLRDAGLFTDGEWRTLNLRAENEWRAEFNIDRRYADRGEEAGNEEARMDVAVAYAEMI